MHIEKRYLRVKVGFLSTCLASLLVGSIAFTPGFNMGPGGFVFISLLAAIPFYMYLFHVKTSVGALATGLALLALFVWLQIYIGARSHSSTAAVGYLWILYVGVPIVAVALIAEGFFGSVSRSSSKPTI